MKRIVLLDDYQGIALDYGGWDRVPDEWEKVALCGHIADADELVEALAGAEIVLLDNMSPEEVAAAAARAHARGVLVEVSGGITLDTIGAYARAGADLISVGALTHSVSAVDIGLDFRSAS